MFTSEWLPRVKIGLYTINYAAPKLIYESITDIFGKATFEIGKGDFLFVAIDEEKIAVAICKQDQTEVKLNFVQNFEEISFELTPPKGSVHKSAPKSQEHMEKFKNMVNERENAHSYRNMASKERLLAGFNFKEIQKFLMFKPLGENQKKMILSTLTDKDFSDVTFETLLDMALAFEKVPNCPPNIFKEYVLTSRVENEPQIGRAHV